MLLTDTQWTFLKKVDATIRLGVVPELQRCRVWVEIGLLLQISMVVFAHVVRKERQWHHQGDITLATVLDDFQHLLFFVLAEVLFEKSQLVQHHVGMLGQGGFEP